jgi:O-antigen/teichoic acid export membrane protein
MQTVGRAFSSSKLADAYTIGGRDSNTTALDAALGIVKGPAVWTIADQAIASVGNFLSGVILARHLPVSSYGAYALLLASMLFLNSLHTALVTCPMSILGASSDHERLRRSSSAALWMTLALLPALGSAMVLAVFCGGNPGGSIAMVPLAGSAVVAMLLWEMQETTRRGLMAELRFASCIPGDALSYLGQAAVLAFMAWRGTLTLPRAFMVIGATSAVAVAVQAIQIGMARIAPGEFREIVRDFWKLGRWTLLANLATFVTTIGYTWTLRLSHGLDATAAFAAMIVPLKLANPLLIGIGNLLVPAVANVAMQDRVAATIRIVGRYAVLGGVAIFGYYGLLFAFPGAALKLVFGAHSSFLLQAIPLRFYLLCMCMAYVETVLFAWLDGLGNTRANFLTRAVQAAASLLIAIPAIAFFGIPGLIAGEFISITLGVMVQLHLLRRTFGGARAATFPAEAS